MIRDLRMLGWAIEWYFHPLSSSLHFKVHPALSLNTTYKAEVHKKRKSQVYGSHDIASCRPSQVGGPLLFVIFEPLEP